MFSLNSPNDHGGQLRSILVNLNDRYLSSILDAIQSHCFVSEIPVIVKLIERPGAFYIEWSEVRIFQECNFGKVMRQIYTVIFKSLWGRMNF